MDAIISALQEEREQAHRLIQRYQKELKGLPPGSFFIRDVGKNRYGYLTFSEKGKIQQRYIGRLGEDEIRRYRELMERKKKLRELKSKAERQFNFLEKALRHARKEG